MKRRTQHSVDLRKLRQRRVPFHEFQQAIVPRNVEELLIGDHTLDDSLGALIRRKETDRIRTRTKLLRTDRLEETGFTSRFPSLVCSDHLSMGRESQLKFMEKRPLDMTQGINHTRGVHSRTFRAKDFVFHGFHVSDDRELRCTIITEMGQTK